MIVIYETDAVLGDEIQDPVRLATYYGSSEETKPEDGVADGSVFVETDTHDLYMWDGANAEWKEWA